MFSGGPFGPHRLLDDSRGDVASEVGALRDCADSRASGKACRSLVKAQAGRALAERQLIEVMHRLANVLQLFSVRIERLRVLGDLRTMQDELGGVLASIHASTDLHRHVLPPRKPTDVDFAVFLISLSAAIGGVTGLRCDVDAETVVVPGQVASRLAAVVNELALNAYKHAYAARAEGNAIRIFCRYDMDGRLRLSVLDHGRGLPAGFDPRAGDGIGLRIIFDTAQQYGGEVTVASDGGACFTLLLPFLRI